MVSSPQIIKHKSGKKLKILNKDSFSTDHLDDVEEQQKGRTSVRLSNFYSSKPQSVSKSKPKHDDLGPAKKKRASE